jgi:nucleoside permease NupC
MQLSVLRASFQCLDKLASILSLGSLDTTQPWGFIFAVKVVPVIIFVGALTAFLFHWGVIQRLVQGINFLIRPLLGTSGIETTAAISISVLVIYLVS